jgi:hypothetical protein
MDAWVSVIVLLRFPVRFWVAVWFAAIPAGMDMSIAIENPKAITTSKARILRLEMLRNALLTIPNRVTSAEYESEFTG